MATRQDSSQSEFRGALNSITTQSATETGMDQVIPSINAELQAPLRMRASNPISRVVQVDNLTVTNPSHGRKHTIAPIGGTALPVVTTFTVTMDATGAGNATPSSGSALALGMTSNQFLKLGVALNSLGQIVLTKGTAAGTLAGAGVPSVPTGSYGIGYFHVATDGSNNVANVDEGNILQYVGGGTSSGTSSSSAGVTYFIDNFESETVGSQPSTWNRYVDAAGTAPVDGTGGSPTANLTFLTSATSPLNGSNSAIIAHAAANVQGFGISRDFTIQNGYSSGRLNSYTLLIDTTDANYVAGYLSLYLYDITNNLLITPSNTALPQGYKGPWTVSWNNNSTSTSYRAIVHCSTSTTTAWSVKLDDVNTNPGVVSQGAAISEWQSYTPTFSAGLGSVTGITFQYRRVGSSMQLSGRFQTGTVAASLASFSLPAGLTVNSTALGGTFNSVVGQYLRGIGAVTQNNSGAIVVAPATSTSNVYFGGGYSTDNQNPQGTQNGSGIFGNTETEELWIYDLPIAEWAGSGTVNLGAGAQTEYAFNTSTSTTTSDSTSFGSGPQGALIQNITAALDRTVRFQSPIQADDLIVVEVSEDRSTWFSIDQFVTNSALTATVVPYSIQNNTNYGMGRIAKVNSTDVRVYFGQYNAANGATYSAAGQAWSVGGGSFYWRVRKVKASSPVGFGMASATDSGLISRQVNPTAFTATNQTAVGGGSVTGGTLTTNYAIFGNMMTVWCRFTGATVAGTVTAFTFDIPASKVSSIAAGSTTRLTLGGANSVGTIAVSLTGTTVTIEKSDGTSFATGSFGIQGQISFPIN